MRGDMCIILLKTQSAGSAPSRGACLYDWWKCKFKSSKVWAEGERIPVIRKG